MNQQQEQQNKEASKKQGRLSYGAWNSQASKLSCLVPSNVLAWKEGVLTIFIISKNFVDLVVMVKNVINGVPTQNAKGSKYIAGKD